ncbi:hypothetical protein C8Q78DRAFT_1011201 [Trametes maxima]|nr:hypothetical protein C8Q78DRAFT_1011201 [Trametes maxima]
MSIAQPAIDSAAEGAFIQREEHSCRLLQVARNEAVKAHGYDSGATRLHLREALSRSCAGKVPYEWQIDVAEALILHCSDRGYRRRKDNSVCHAASSSRSAKECRGCSVGGTMMGAQRRRYNNRKHPFYC